MLLALSEESLNVRFYNLNKTSLANGKNAELYL